MDNGIKTTDFPAKTEAAETDTVLANVSNKTSKVSIKDILGKVALSALKTSAKTITGAINALAQPTKGMAVATGDASCIWAKFLTINFKNDYYIDSPIEIVVGQRAKTLLNTLTLLFNSGNIANISSFYFNGYSGSAFRAAMNDGNTCDVYAKLTNVYDQVSVYDIKYNDNLLEHVDFTFPNEFVSELPSSATPATYRAIASHDTSGRNIADAFGDIPLLTCDFNNPPNKYIFHAAPGSANAPPGLGGNSWNVIQQYPGNTKYSTQLAFGFNQSKIAMRRKNNSSTWSEWEYFYPDGCGGVYIRDITSSNLALYGASIDAGSAFTRYGRTVVCTLVGIKTAASYGSRWNNLVHIPIGFCPVKVVCGIGRKLYGETEASLEAEGSVIKFVKSSNSTTQGALTFYATLTWITADDPPG